MHPSLAISRSGQVLLNEPPGNQGLTLEGLTKDPLSVRWLAELCGLPPAPYYPDLASSIMASGEHMAAALRHIAWWSRHPDAGSQFERAIENLPDTSDASRVATLRALGYDVDTANDGPSALQLIERKRYGIAIIDYQMPGMNGVDLFRRIRVARPDMAGVFLTGHTTINVVSPAIEAGVLRVLSKPVDFEELIPIIEDHIGTAA